MNLHTKILLTTLACLCCTLSANTGEGIHLFILSGQSNMHRFNPDLTFTPAVNAEFGKKNVIVVKDAQGGQPIYQWYKDWKPAAGGSTPKGAGKLYDNLMNKVNAAIEGKEIKTVTFIWMQGERDAKESQGDVYADSLNGLFQQLEKDLGRRDINYIIGRISDFDLENTKYPHWTKIRESQVSIAESLPNAVWVDTDDLNDGVDPKGRQIVNDLHYSAVGYKILGTRYAERAIELIKGSTK